MNDWRSHLVTDDDRLRELLTSSRRIAVLGIRTEEQADQPSFQVPRALQSEGYEIIPVPVYFPDVTEILGEPVYRKVSDIPGPVDIVEVFRRGEAIPAHLPDLLSKRPRAVWFQLGIRNDEAAETLAREGILVVQDRCMIREFQRLL